MNVNTCLGAVSAAFILFLGSADASAQEAHEAPGGLALALEVGPNFVVDGGDVGDSVGVGLSGRLGYRLLAGPLFLTPEAKLGFESPGTPNAFRILGGLRLGLNAPISPNAFAHLGGTAGNLEGFAWDVGGGVDFVIGPLILGGFVSYNRVEDQQLDFAVDSGAWDWFQAGASIAVVFR